MQKPNTDPQSITPRSKDRKCKVSVLRICQSLCYRTSAASKAPNTNVKELVDALPPAATPPVTRFPVQNNVSNMFQSAAQKVDIGGNAKLMNIAAKTNIINHWHVGTHGLEEMRDFVSFSAQFDSSAQDPERVCHPGTRQNVLKRIQDWIEDPNSTERIFWLHGPAGAGKSAIAQTVAQSCGRQKVVATFFFFRSDASRNDGNKLFPTLAYQLAFSIPAMKEHIAQSLHERPDLPTKGVEIQFKELITMPFRALAESASQPSSDCVTPVFNECQQLAPVIIIDGVDECTDEKLQQRFLRVIGDVVKSRSLPFRFLICSRPEAHIEHTLNNFKASILPLDLAKLDDANRDIEKYLVDQFSCITSNRGLRPTWPGQWVIKDIIYKSSGNFIFASVVIRFTGDEDSMPEDQLAIIMNLKPPGRISPFAALDELYLEILRQQPYPDFLRTFLALLVGRNALPDYAGLYKDDAKLMNVSEKELQTKLRRMRSLLKFEPHIDVHHRSFLDFINKPSRSGDYHVSKEAGIKRYIGLTVDSIVRHVSRAIENPDYHKTHHLDLNVKGAIDINLSVGAVLDVSQALVQIQDDILKLSDTQVASDLLFCEKCAVFNVMRPFLLRLAISRCMRTAHDNTEQLVSEGNHANAITLIRTEPMQNAVKDDLDNSLSSLLARLQETKLGLSPNADIINYTYSIIRFDCIDVALRVSSMSDAQNLVDFLLDLIDEKTILSLHKPDGMSKAVQLVLNIFVRIPILPRSLFLNVENVLSSNNFVGISHICTSALLWRVLDHNYIDLEMYFRGFFPFIPYKSPARAERWQEVLSLNAINVTEFVFDVARAIQYLHSMGVTPGVGFHIGNICNNSSHRPKIRISAESLGLINPFTGSMSTPALYEGIFGFGWLLYQVYSQTEFDAGSFSVPKSMEDKRRSIITKRPSKPKIPEYAWQLIQSCCAEDPRNRPTIDEVVKELKLWENEPQ